MKKIVSMMAGIAAGSLFAVEVPSVQEITFSTQGQDKYADGSAVMDGECYALVWSQDGVFEGINVDGTAKDANDKVLYIGNFAKGGQCGLVSFQIADGVVNGGQYDVWVLDTRVFDNGAVKQVGKQNGKLTASHAAKATTATIQVSSDAARAPTTAKTAAGGTVAGGATVADVRKPTIVSFKLDTDGNGQKVAVLELADTVTGVNYAAEGSNSLEKNEVVSGKVTSGNGGTITVIVPATGDQAFFWGKVK